MCPGRVGGRKPRLSGGNNLVPAGRSAVGGRKQQCVPLVSLFCSVHVSLRGCSGAPGSPGASLGEDFPCCGNPAFHSCVDGIDALGASPCLSLFYVERVVAQLVPEEDGYLTSGKTVSWGDARAVARLEPVAVE